MFRRKTETADVAASTTTPKAEGKGRPTPTRKEAEAARMARVRPPRTRKEQAAASRARRAESSAQMQQAMRTGDDRYLPARDKGPVRRFVRDYVDSKFTVSELLIPILVVVMLLGFVGGSQLAGVANLFMVLVMIAVVVSMVTLRFGLHRQLRQRFPDQSYRGLTYYAVVRAMQLRFLRLPKRQVRIGQELPQESYRR